MKQDQKGGLGSINTQIGVQNNITNYSGVSTASRIASLLLKLESEIENNEQIRETIDKLQRFRKTRPYDDVVGLIAKLKAAGRQYECDDALDKKELFSKLLERFSLYASAQEILAFLLARVEYQFTQFVYPRLKDLDIVAVNRIVDTSIIEPTITDCGSSVFAVDHSVAMGMVYWLAEQCHVRWHQ